MSDEIDVGGVVATVRLDSGKADESLNNVIRTINRFGSALDYVITIIDKLQARSDNISPAMNTAGAAVQGTENKFTAAANAADRFADELSSAESSSAALAGSTKSAGAEIDKITSAADKFGATSDKITETASALSTVDTSAASAAQSVNQTNTAMKSNSVEKYDAKLAQLNAEYQKQTELVNNLGAQLDALVEDFYKLSAASGDGDSFDPAKIFPTESAALDKEFDKLEEIKAKIKEVTAAREKAASAAVSAANKQTAAANNVAAATKKEATASKAANIAFDTGATALRAVTSAAGGTVSQIGYLGTELIYLKRNIQATSSKGLMMASVFSFSIMAAITLVTAGISALMKQEEKRQQAFKEGIENCEKYSKELKELNQSLSILSNAESTTENLTGARNNLVSTFEDMIVGYTDEGEAILANNEQLERQIDLLNTKISLSRQEIIANSTALEGYKELSNIIETNKFEPMVSDYEKTLISLNKRLIELHSDGQKYIEAYIQENLKLADSNSGLTLSWEKLSQAQQAVGNSLIMDYIDDVLNEKITVDEALLEIRKKLSDPSVVESYKQQLMNLTQNAEIEAQKIAAAIDAVNTSVEKSLSGLNRVQSDMASAYAELTESGKLAQSTVTNLIGTYPQLIDYLDAETGQLNLTDDTMRELYEIQKQLQIAELEGTKAKLQQNKEIILSNYELAKSELDKVKNSRGVGSLVPEKTAAVENAEKQLKELETNYQRIETIINRINNTEFDLSGNTEQALQLSEAVNDLNTAISESITEMSGFQSKMSSAYSEMTENGKLSQSTINSLISTYPQLIDYIDAETGQLNLTEDAIRNLYQIQKQLQIAELEGAKAKLQQNEDKIKSNYKLAESELLAAQSALMTSGTNQWKINQYYEKSSAFDAAKKEMEELQASYNRIDTLIETINNAELDLTAEGNGIKNASKSVSEYSQALERLNHQKKMGRLRAKEEIAALEELGRRYVLSADERMDLEYRIYSAKKQYEEEIESARAKALQEQYTKMENLKALGKLNAQQELEWLERIRKRYKLNADERIALEIKIYNLKEELRQNEVSALDDLGAAITEALKNQYEEQRKAEQDRINESIEAWEQWEKSTVAAIQAEIDALDALEKEQENQSAAAEYYRKSQELKLQIAYEKDDYQRKQLEKELNRLTEEEQERLRKEEIKKKKEELESQIEEARNTAEERKKALEEELDVINENYDKLTSALYLRAQTEQIIMQQSQEQIISLIKSYAPEYDLAGQSIGESLYEAFKSKVDNIYSYIEEVMSAIRKYQENAKAAAVKAANDFEQSYHSAAPSSQPPNSVSVYYTSNFNTPVQSPVQTKRAIESTASGIAAMIR